MKHRWIAILLILALVLSACARQNDIPPASSANSSGAAHIPASLKTTLSKDALAGYDFTEQAMAYLSDIASHFPNRGVADSGSDHDAFGSWLLSELNACGYDRVQTQDFEETGFSDEPVRGRNYILTIPGRSETGQIIVVPAVGLREK